MARYCEGGNELLVYTKQLSDYQLQKYTVARQYLFRTQIASVGKQADETNTLQLKDTK